MSKSSSRVISNRWFCSRNFVFRFFTRHLPSRISVTSKPYSVCTLYYNTPQYSIIYIDTISCIIIIVSYYCARARVVSNRRMHHVSINVYSVAVAANLFPVGVPGPRLFSITTRTPRERPVRKRFPFHVFGGTITLYYAYNTLYFTHTQVNTEQSCRR